MIASIITALYLLGHISAMTASNFLFICGILLIIAEVGFSTFWIVGFNGVLAIYVGYVLRTGDQSLMGVHVDWSVLFGIAFIELLMLVTSIYLINRHRHHKVSTGTESMVGHGAVVVEWSSSKGQVRIQGELWQAQSDQDLQLATGDNVTVTSVKGLIVKIAV